LIKTYTEEIASEFEGTIIDLETIGDFVDRYDDSRRYREILPVIFGSIDREGVTILCAGDRDSISELEIEIVKVLDLLKKPFYAFNADFEGGVLFHRTKKEVSFGGELNREKFESKKGAVQSLGISNYGDPCNDNGWLCSQEWLKGNTEYAILHNRSCLLKERDILLKRGFRKPDGLRLTG
jgi:hypothetical protein